MARNTAHIPPFGLRLQAELKERIERAAEKNGRSQNAEIVSRLEMSFAFEEGSRGEFESQKRIAALEKVQANLASMVLDQSDELERLAKVVEQLDQFARGASGQ